MQTHSSKLRTSNDVEVARFDDISPWARRAGIVYPIFVDPALRVEVETRAPTPDDPAGPHEPLFYLLVPLRFVLNRKATDCRFDFVVGRKWPAGGITVGVVFRSDEMHGDYVELSLKTAADSNYEGRPLAG
jgi:hypothetical protein